MFSEGKIILHKRIAKYLFYGLWLFFLLSVYCLHAADEIPEGFGDLSTEEVSDVKVYYGNNYLGRMVATFDEGYFKFEDPELLKGSLTMINDRQAVIDALSGELDPHTELACNSTNRRECKTLTPKTVAIIFNPDKYTVRLYINAKYLKPAEYPKLQYLEESNAPLSFTNQFETFIHGNQEEDHYSINFNNALAKGNNSLIVNSNLTGPAFRKTDIHGETLFRLYNVEYNHYDKRLVYSAGMLNSSSSLFTPTLTIFGARLHTNKGLMQNERINYGTPIQVNLPVQSIVEVLRDGRVIYSKFFEAGNHFLDTSSFPTGVYAITVKTIRPDNSHSEFQQLYVKNTSIPALGYPDYSISIGYLPKKLGGNETLPTISSTAVLQSDYEKRLTRNTSFQIGEVAERHYALADIGYSWFNDISKITPSAAIATDRDYGLGLVYNLRIHKAWTLNVLFRHMYNQPSEKQWEEEHHEDPHDDDDHHDDDHHDDLFTALRDEAPAGGENEEDLSPIDNIRQLSSVTTVTLNYNNPKFQIGAQYSNELQSSGERYHTYGLNWTQSLPSLGHILFKLVSSAVKDHEGWTYLITLSASLRHHQFTHTLATQFEKTPEAAVHEDDNNWTKELQYNIAYNPRGTRHSFKVGVDKSADKTQYNALASMKFGEDIGFTAQGSYIQKAQHDDTYSYLVDLNHTDKLGLAMARGSLVWASDMSETSGTIVKVVTDDKTAKFDITVNNAKSFEVKANKFLFIPLKPFQRYSLTITSIGDNALDITEQPKTFILYPHNIMPIEVTAKQYYSIMGIFTYPNGDPVKDAEVNGGLSFTRTDGEGYGQLELYQGSTLELTPKEGLPCVVETHDFKPEDGFLYLDTIECKPVK